MLYCRGIKKGSNSLAGWNPNQKAATVAEMPDLPWDTIKERIRRIRETGMLGTFAIYSLLTWDFPGGPAVKNPPSIGHGGNLDVHWQTNG